MLKVTLIMPNFNGAKYLENAISSFLLQSYEDKELIIVDGKSSDASHAIIDKYSSLYRNIKWLNESDCGISNAINIGVAHSDGDIIGYLGSDDILASPDVLGKVVYNFRLLNVHAVACNSMTYMIGEQRAFKRTNHPVSYTKRNLLKLGTLTGLQNVFFRSEVLQLNRFDENNKYSMDYEFYLRLVTQSFVFLNVDITATINIFDGNISHRLAGIQEEEALSVAWRYCGTHVERLMVIRRWLKSRRYLRRVLKFL